MSRYRYLLFAITALFLFPATGLSQETILKNGQSFALRISGVPADEVALVSQKFSISDAGIVRLPYLKAGIKAAGLKPSALARKIEDAYKNAEIYTRPTIQIDVTIDPTERYVSVIGEIRSPGTVSYRPGITLLDAIAQTGGFTDFASTKQIKLTRGTKVTYHSLRKGDPKENVALEPNDIITVRPRGWGR